MKLLKRAWQYAGFLLVKFAISLEDNPPVNLNDLGLFIDSETEPAAFVAEKLNLTLEELRDLLKLEFLDPLDNIAKKQITFL